MELGTFNEFSLPSPPMRSTRWWTIVILTLMTVFGSLSAQESAEWEIESLSDEGGFSYQPNTGIATAENGVIVRFQDPEHGTAVLQADRVTLDQLSGNITAEGNVTLSRDGQAWRGEQLDYNFRTQSMGATDYRTGKSPYFAAGTSVQGDDNATRYTAGSAYVTTDDVKNPNHRIKAKHLTIVPGKYFSAKHATVYVGKVPVMYLPYLRASLDGQGNHWSLTPGYRSRFGGFLLSTYHYQVLTNLSADLNFDYRTKRGFGGGPDFSYDLGKYGQGQTRTYYSNDDLPGFDRDGMPIPDDRYRLQIQHSVAIRTNITAKLSVDRLSDPNINRDFFENEYRANTQPRSYLEVEQLSENYALALLAQPQVNDFYERIERLPEVKLTAFRQQIGNTPLYYESESSAGYLGHQFRNNVTNDFYATRVDTWHQLVVPHTFFGWLNVQPRIGGRSTYYTSSNGRGTTLEETRRNVMNTGIEANFRAARTFPLVTNRFWGLNGLRHIIQPSANYVYVPTPGALPPELPRFDYEIPSLRWLPIEYPDYNSIDSIDAQNVVRLGIRNKLQTKRGKNDRVVDFVNWNVFADVRVNPRANQTDLGDLNSDLSFRPNDWLHLNSYTRYGIDDGEFRLANNRITLTPEDVWSVSVGHLYLRDELDYWGIGNNVFYSSMFYRLNENWGARMNHQFEARDGTLEEQSYTVYRDFRSWTGAFSFRIRDERTAPQDYTVAVILSLKAFPRFGVGNDTVQSSLLYGR